MRVAALLGLGLPVLAVSGVVAYGSIREISKSLSPAPIVQEDVPVMIVSQRAASFLNAGKANWKVPEEAALVLPAVLDQPSAMSQPVAFERTSPTAALSDNAGLKEQDVPSNRTPERPEPVVFHTVPSLAKVPVTQERPAAVEPGAERAFKMPWQTGVFQ